MKISRVLFVLVLLVFSAKGLKAGDGPDLSGLANLMEAQNDYRRTLIEARLAESEIQLNQAKTALAYAEATKNYAEVALINTKIAHLNLYMQAMAYELNRVMHEQANINVKIKRITVQAELCAGLALGDTSYGAFQCLRYFRRHVIPTSIQQKTLFKEVAAMEASEFISNFGQGETIAFPGGNVGKLIQFLEKQNYSVEPYGAAHSELMEFLNAVTSETERKLQEYYRYMDGIRAGTLNVFELPNG
ncbi:MAG: hypothetical protein R3B54_01905 [Bdellovibrionota bacterium]